MKYFKIFPLCLGFLISFSSSGHARDLIFAPANGPFQIRPSLEEEEGCTMNLSKPLQARVLAETETHFQLQWSKEINGCYWLQLTRSFNPTTGWVKKSDLIWEQDQETQKVEVPPTLRPKERPRGLMTGQICSEEKPSQIVPESEQFENIDALISHLKNEYGGLKNPADVDKYISCYPYANDGRENFEKYAPFVEMASDVIRAERNGVTFEVNPSLSKCLIRRESGFDPKNSSGAGDGLGQQTPINRKDLNARIQKEGSWEKAAWEAFFREAKKTSAGRKMLEQCPGSVKKGKPPRMKTSEDSFCPLQSIAASHIYLLQIQMSLQNASDVKQVSWENELEYQLSLAAAYNLGHSAASKAVDELIVDEWLDAIRKKSPKKAKRKEVAAHIESIRNCMQADNWDPMFDGDRWQCE